MDRDRISLHTSSVAASGVEPSLEAGCAASVVPLAIIMFMCASAADAGAIAT